MWRVVSDDDAVRETDTSAARSVAGASREPSKNTASNHDHSISQPLHDHDPTHLLSPIARAITPDRRTHKHWRNSTITCFTKPRKQKLSGRIFPTPPVSLLETSLLSMGCQASRLQLYLMCYHAFARQQSKSSYVVRHGPAVSGRKRKYAMRPERVSFLTFCGYLDRSLGRQRIRPKLTLPGDDQILAPVTRLVWRLVDVKLAESWPSPALAENPEQGE